MKKQAILYSGKGEDISQIPREEIAAFLHEHLVALRKVAYAVDWREMVYYLEMASTVAELGGTEGDLN